MRLIIDTEIAGRGEANDFLHHVVREINGGYVVGEGWELRVDDSHEEETTNDDGTDDQNGQDSNATGAETDANASDETKVGDETTTPPEGSQSVAEGVDPGISTVTEEKEPWNQNQ